VIRLRPEQLDAFRTEAREALADRLARRAAERFPEKVLGRGAAEVRSEARRLAGGARERGLVSEEDVTLFYDLSMELGTGFEQGPSGAWARQLLKERLSPHARVLALRERVLFVEEWDPYRERARKAVTGRVTRIVGKGPPRRLDALKARRELLAALAARLKAPASGGSSPEGEAERAGRLRRVEKAWRVVQNEYALRLKLEMIAARGREKAAAERAEPDPARRAALAAEVSVLASRFERTRRILLEGLAESAPRPGSADAGDPCVARIETDAISEREAVRAEAARKLRVARDLCVPSGTANAGDGVVVAIDLAWLPGELLDRLRRAGTRVVACRGSVADLRPDLAGARPCGWPPGFGWKDVPAFYDGARNEVVVATRGHGPRRSGQVPLMGDGHASASLAVHVACHAIDARCGSPSSSPEFRAARAADLVALPEYCRQPGTAGLDESWAESAARWAAGPAEMAAELPNLHAYWRERAVVRTGAGRPRIAIDEDGAVRTTRVWRRSSIGAASLDAEGAIVLTLRASDGRGILGDARVVCPKGDPRYAEVLSHLGGLAPGETKPVPPWPAAR
jgi:hypothetical protein